MLLNESLTPSQYAELTDSHIKVVLDDWSHHDDELLSLYAGKLLSRREFHKSLRIDTLDVNMVNSLEKDWRRSLKSVVLIQQFMFYMLESPSVDTCPTNKESF